MQEIDYVVSQHAEQDHSGVIPEVLERYPKARDLLETQLQVRADRVRVVEDGESISLGNKTLRFIYRPWVHWPETMVTHIPESKILLTCDFFGSHIATTDVYVTDRGQVYEAAKRYFAEIMMPFRPAIRTNLEKLGSIEFDLIAPSHGPLYDDPSFILDAYRDGAGGAPSGDRLRGVPRESASSETAVRGDNRLLRLAHKVTEAHRSNEAIATG